MAHTYCPPSDSASWILKPDIDTLGIASASMTCDKGSQAANTAVMESEWLYARSLGSHHADIHNPATITENVERMQ